MIPAAFYARVSTTQQEKEATIESQIALLKEFALRQGYDIAPQHQFLDQAVSGARLDRPALDRLRDSASDRQFKVVLCASPDRLARNYVYQRVILDELARAGVDLIFLSQPDHQDNPQAELLLGLQGLFAEYERAVIRERMRRGRLHRLKTGQIKPNHPPFGYRYIPLGEIGGGQWHLVAHQADVVRDIFNWYQAEMRVCEIVRRLNEQGIPSPTGQQWGEATLRHLLHDSAYRGQGYYNRKQTMPQAIGQPRKFGRGYLKEPRYQLRSPEEWITIEVPAIVSDQLWQEVQAKLSQHQRFSTRNNHQQPYLLRGLLTCGICGYTLIGRTAHDRQTYFCKHGGCNCPPDVPEHHCVISADEVETLVWQALTDLLQHPQRLTAAWRQLTQTDLPDAPTLTSLQCRHKELDKQWQRLLDLYQDGLVEKAELAQRKSILDTERKQIAGRLELLSQQHQRQQYETDLILTCQDFAKRVEIALASPAFQLKQDVIRLLIEQIVVLDDSITIKHIVPAEDDALLCRLETTRTNP